jgi:ATP-dependent phosphofructokinase / diphosphate-dependent phosphofructokinase
VPERERGGQRFTIIVVAEGGKPAAASSPSARRVADSPDPIRLGGAGEVLAGLLQPYVESEVRTTILGHVQRGGTPPPTTARWRRRSGRTPRRW